MSKRIEIKYLNLDGKLIKVNGNSLYFDGKKIGVLFSTPPASASSTGTAGDIAYDDRYFYVCVANNSWTRTAIARW